jgi:erythromycin esterase-like protein
MSCENDLGNAMANRTGWLFRSFLVCLLVHAPYCQLGAQEPSGEVVDWLKQNAIRLEGVEAGRGFADLQPLKQLIGDARIVSLGESTHGSREIFQMKHRLLEYLVSELGFTIFSIEANMPEAYRLNGYVLGGDGDPSKLISGMYFWTWNTHEVLDMVEWMRNFNASGKGHVEFTGFDMQTPDVAMQEVLNFLQKADQTLHGEAKRVYDAAVRAQPRATGQFAVATGTFPIDAARGKQVKFQGWIKTENLRDGFAGLWWRADGPGGKVLAFDNMGNRKIAGTNDWELHSIELSVPHETTNINFGVLMPGTGKAWFDGLQVTLDGQLFSDAAFDFDFESPTIKGLIPVFGASIDDQVGKEGKRSLRLQSGVAAPGGMPAEAFQKLVASARAVQAQLEKNRDDLVKTFDGKKVDWSIQNARIVDQALRQRAGDMRVRDASMADNVDWILAQNPEAKIVLWAHNYHVSKQPMAMGSYLDKKFGAKHLAIAFATSQGEYQAIGSGRLGVHKLQTPPPGSIEAVMQRAGIPQFLLDLRNVGAGSPAATWLSQPHQFRSIGALAMDQQFAATDLRKLFDVVIYIDKTTAAKPIAGTGSR